MNQPITIDNLDSLKKRIANTGFGNRFDQQIDQHFAESKTQFRLFTSEAMEKGEMDFELDINSKANKGYFNGYKATLQKVNEQPIAQWFNANDRITINEAFCMLADQTNPRVVHKMFYDENKERYGTWLQIDFTKLTESGNHEMKRFHDKYGYNLLEKLDDYAFKQLDSPKQKLVAYNILEQGRELELSPVNQDKYATVVIRANPERKTISILDTEGKFLSHDQFRTEEAKTRIQQERNSREANVSFVNKNIEQNKTTKEDQPKINPTAVVDQSAKQEDDIKKKNNNQSLQPLKKNIQPRIVQAAKDAKGKRP